VSCDWARKLMVLADGLSKEERVELEEHLRQCGSCNSEWQKWQRLFSLLSHLPSLHSTPQERAQLVQSLQSVPEVPELSCAAARKFIWRWLDDDLSPQERTSLIVHLANCDRCQVALWQSEQTVRTLRSLPQLRATAAEKEALKARLRRLSRRPTLVPFLWRVALPVAAAAALVFAVLLKWQPYGSNFAPSVARKEGASPSIAQPRPATPNLPAPKVAERTEKPKPETQRPQVLAQTHRPAEPKRVQIAAKQQVQVGKPREQPQARQVAVPEPPKETVVASAQPVPEPKPTVTAPQTSVAEGPKIASPMAIVAPVPRQPLPPAEPEIAAVPSSQTLSPQPVQEAPAVASLKPEARQLVALPPITSESDSDLIPQPKRVQLTVVPPSQRLYQKSGVALVTVPPEKRPVKVVEEKALVPDLSIPLAAERYRSHTATVPFFRFSISW